MMWRLTRRHPGAEDIARLEAADLAPGQARRIRAHLAGCPRCAQVRSELAAVSAALAAAPAPPMPAHLAARISDALAAEAVRRTAAPGTVGEAGLAAAPDIAAGPVRAPSGTAEPGAAEPGAGRPGRPARPDAGLNGADRAGRTRSPGRGARPWLASPAGLRVLAGAAAAVVVLAGGGYELASHLGSSGTTGTGAASSSGPGSTPGRRAGSAGQAAPFGGPRAPAAVPAAGSPLHYGTGRHAAVLTPVATGTDYQPGRLAGQVRQAIARAGRVSSPSSRSTPAAGQGSGGTELGHPAAALSACVTRIAAGRPVRLVDVAAYQGLPATVVAVGAPGAATVTVYVAGPGCSGSASDLLTRPVTAAG